MPPSPYTIGNAYHFSRSEFGGEPGVVAELSSAYSTPRKVLREAAHGGDERCLATFTRNSRVRLLLATARGAVARDAVPERARQQPSGPVNGLHRAIISRVLRLTTRSAHNQHRTWQHHNAHFSHSFSLHPFGLDCPRN